MPTIRSDRLEGPTLVPAPARRVALAVAVLVVLAAVALVLFVAVGGPFGTLNDALNAATGVASALLAGLTLTSGWARAPLDRAGAVAGIVGGGVLAAGSFLVVTGVTGWFLAGVVSGVGAALVGLWLLALNRPRRWGGRPGDGTSRLGLAAGAVMATGLLGLPGGVAGVDDWADAPWYVGVGMLGWLGTYVLYPAWCLRVSRLD